MLVRKLAFQGKHKLANKWEDAVYVVVKQVNRDTPVYTVEPESGQGPKRTLHRNHLLPCLFTTDNSPTPQQSSVRPPVQTRSRSKQHLVEESGDAASDEDEEVMYGVEDVIQQISSDPDAFLKNVAPGCPDVVRHTEGEISGMVLGEEEARTESQPSPAPTTVSDGKGIHQPVTETHQNVPEPEIDPGLPEESMIDVTLDNQEQQSQDTQPQQGEQDVMPDDASDLPLPGPRRSSRQVKPPNKLTYPTLGSINMVSASSAPNPVIPRQESVPLADVTLLMQQYMTLMNATISRCQPSIPPE